MPKNTQTTAESVRDARLAKLATLQQSGIDPYPADTKRTHSVADALAAYPRLAKSRTRISLAGRIMTWRAHGQITFATLRDASGDIQVAWQADTVSQAAYQRLSGLDSGDFIECQGTLFTTKRGERSLQVAKSRLLAKSLRPLPEKWHGLKDPEERYRKRYLDMLVNPEVRRKLRTRSQLITALRRFLEDDGFIELENPILETVASGAAARPFKTHINAYDLDLYLRIAIGELWQKRSLVGGFEKVFEIGRAFRNEGVDYAHNPDFTMLEYYWAYADYRDNMKFHERLLPQVVKTVTGGLKVKHDGQTINFKSPYPRLTFREAIKRSSGIDVDRQATAAQLRKAMRAKGYDAPTKETHRQLLDGLFKASFRRQQIQPVFIIDHPTILSPLAKPHPDDPTKTQRFQLVVATYEICNSYSELNDPQLQAARFREQAAMAAAGDEEAMAIDDDFVEALEYGMPPATGTGIGIDRLAALLTDSHSIREVTPYPLMKPKHS